MPKAPTLKQENYDAVNGTYTMPYSDALDQVHDLALSIQLCEAQLPGFIAKARAAGATWAQLGTALGVTRSAAQQRFG